MTAMPAKRKNQSTDSMNLDQAGTNMTGGSSSTKDRSAERFRSNSDPVSDNIWGQSETISKVKDRNGDA